nr:Ty3/gypsy retrotransposon protein [Tanacetum cinerariifolium]
MSTAYHPQSDGQTKVVNSCLECYLRCMTEDKPKEQMQWFSLTEYWYNTNFHSSTNITPFEAVYGQPPPTYVPYEMEASGVLPAVDLEGLLLKTLAAILDRRLGKVRNSLVMYVLVQWTGESVEDAILEIYGDLIVRLPSFDQAF